MSSLPTMQIFLDVVKNNYISAKKKCDSLGIELRPHVKTSVAITNPNPFQPYLARSMTQHDRWFPLTL